MCPMPSSWVSCANIERSRNGEPDSQVEFLDISADLAPPPALFVNLIITDREN